MELKKTLKTYEVSAVELHGLLQLPQDESIVNANRDGNNLIIKTKKEA